MRTLHTGKRFTTLLFISLLCASLMIISGCTGGGYNKTPWEARGNTQSKPAVETPSDLSLDAVESYSLNTPTQQETGLPSVKVAILLPLSGQHSKLGESMLNAAQMALFDLGFSSFELLPKDTQGTPEGAQSAARQAVQEGAKLVLGPVFSAEVKAARQITQSANINMVAFSTDWTLANQETFLIGFLPFDQIERITSYAVQNGYDRIGVISPQDSYGDAVAAAYNSMARNQNIKRPHIERFQVSGHDLDPVIRRFSNYDARKSSSNAAPPYNAVLMPVGGSLARQVGSYLSHYDMPPSQVKRLGTGLMDDSVLATDKSLDGTWFAAPEPRLRAKFENKFKSVYYSKPPRIASLAYDATALSIILARMGLEQNGSADFSYHAITNPNGFSGVDGIFRFRPDGISERGLAVLEYRNKTMVVINNAPKTFQKSAY